jgi:cardiolipin synthase A/B
VHVIMDYIGSRRAGSGKFERMEKAGVELVRWRKPAWYQFSRFNHRTHRKLLIVDGHTGFTGGANIADAWEGTPHDDGAYRDNHYRLRGPIVGQLQASFARNWLRARGELLLDERYFPPLEPAGELPMQVVNSFPREGHHRMRELFLHAFAAARQSIRIGSAYFYPDQTVLDALAEAARRGVEVDILVPGNSIDQGYIRQASINRWEPMLEAGVRIHEYELAMYHAKLLIVDDRWVSFGSTNMDNRSFRINDETNVNVLDGSLTDTLVAQMRRDMEHARRYDLERWRQRPWHHRFYGWLAMTIGAHL